MALTPLQTWCGCPSPCQHGVDIPPTALVLSPLPKRHPRWHWGWGLYLTSRHPNPLLTCNLDVLEFAWPALPLSFPLPISLNRCQNKSKRFCRDCMWDWIARYTPPKSLFTSLFDHVFEYFRWNINWGLWLGFNFYLVNLSNCSWYMSML